MLNLRESASLNGNVGTRENGGRVVSDVHLRHYGSTSGDENETYNEGYVERIILHSER